MNPFWTRDCNGHLPPAVMRRRLIYFFTAVGCLFGLAILAILIAT